ncbi:cardioacceleratory peptide receptor-like isoform X2 [Periplaneta americana]|uniref:cardioacceleratory peptide receptor-like isoform X2 n=1 Tax=Periplaneta americana TaxID=6978 RepID=UPI0037E8B368
MMTKAKRESRSLRNMEEYAVLNVLPTFPVLPSGSNVTEAAPTEINQTTPNTTSPDFNSFYFYEVEQFTVLWILFALIVLGNSAVLVALFLNKSRKSRMNFFIMQLAVADLTVGLISVLTDIVWRITVTWHAGNFACKLIRFLQAVVTYSSTYVLVALSIDRYDAITHPMNFSGSWRRARVLVAAAWVLSAFFSIPIIILYEEKPVQGKAQCWIEFQEPWQWQVYMTLVAVALFVLPALIISGCYTVIVLTIWSKSKILTPPSKSCNNRGGHRQQHDEQDSRRASSRGLIPRAKIKTVKMTFVIVFVFILCWSPYFVFGLLQVYGHVPRTQTNIAVATFIQSLAPLNSAANPVIYCLFSTHMCRALRKVPPISWLLTGLALCFPGLRSRYRPADSSSTVTETLTQHSSRRSGSIHNATSLRHHVRLQTGETKVAMSAV